MKQHPILFSTPMVQAILEGRKTMTRRIIKPQPQKINGPIMGIVPNHPDDWAFPENKDFRSSMISCKPNGPTDWDKRNCPYGQIGDIFWVREVHYRFGHWDKNGLTKTGKQKWKFVAVPDSDFYFEGDALPEKSHKSRAKGREEFNLLYKRLARFMPKVICRIYLEITGIRVERLQDISYSDAMAEGIAREKDGFHLWFKNYAGVEFSVSRMFKNDAVSSFHSLWQSINGPESWTVNPWVWVIEFREIDKP